MSKRSLVLIGPLVLTVTSVSSVLATGYLHAGATCADNANITLTWTWDEFTGYPPTGRPDWVGYDVLRRTLVNCGPFVRVNDTPFPRTVGATQTYTFVEPAPASNTPLEYQVIYVDANRQPLSLTWPDREPTGGNEVAWVSCPDQSAPVTEGFLVDWNWALSVDPCPGSCYPSVYFEDPTLIEELRPLVGTGKSVRLFGQAGYGSIEGAAMQVDRYEVSDCIATPTRSTTWGHLKLLYR